MLKARHRGGFTLIEMVVTILVIGLVMGVSVMGFNSVTNALLREETGRLAAVIRGVYSLAALNGRAYRIVFDLDKGNYYVEFSENPVLLAQERERAVEGAKPEEEDKSKRLVTTRDGAATPRLPKPGWHRVSRADIGLVEEKSKAIVLSKEVQFEGVFTTHQLDTYSKGKTELYFFPSGWTEQAFIYLKEKGAGGDTFTVEVAPLTARTTIHAKKVRIPAEALEERGKEDEGESIF